MGSEAGSLRNGMGVRMGDAFFLRPKELNRSLETFPKAHAGNPPEVAADFFRVLVEIADVYREPVRGEGNDLGRRSARKLGEGPGNLQQGDRLGVSHVIDRGNSRSR